MKKKIVRGISATPEYDSQRETRVLLEEMNKGIKTIGEQYGTIAKKLEEHDGRFEKIESELNTVKIAVMENSRDIQELKAGQEELRGEIQELREEQQELKTGQQEIKEKLDTVALDHEHRIQKLEMAK